jgi:type III secretion protein U
MASEGSGGSQQKTEEPTPKRLRDARRKGDVWQSADFSTTVTLVVFAIAAVLGAQAAFAALTRRFAAALDAATRPGTEALVQAQALLAEVAFASVVFAAATVVVGALASGLQVGGLVSFGRVTPDLKRLHPMEGLRRIFSWRTAVEALRLLIKLVALALLLWLLARGQLPLVARAQQVPVLSWLAIGGRQMEVLLLVSAGLFGAVALADVVWQRWDYRRRQRMTKDEVRREFKEREGDPILRGRRKQLHHEISFNDMLQRVREASVVVVNPTHVAVALHYDAASTPLPVVVAKGEGEVARAIREAAEEAGVPIYRDVPLARALQAGAPLDDYIPDELMAAVAHVLRWVERMRNSEEGPPA